MRRTGPESLQNNGDILPVVNLRIETAGVSCEEYTLLAIAGPNDADLPTEIRNRMNQHLEICKYHNSNGFIQSGLGTPVTSVLERAALGVIEKYMNPNRSNSKNDKNKPSSKQVG